MSEAKPASIVSKCLMASMIASSSRLGMSGTLCCSSRLPLPLLRSLLIPRALPRCLKCDVSGEAEVSSNTTAPVPPRAPRGVRRYRRRSLPVLRIEQNSLDVIGARGGAYNRAVMTRLRENPTILGFVLNDVFAKGCSSLLIDSPSVAG